MILIKRWSEKHQILIKEDPKEKFLLILFNIHWIGKPLMLQTEELAITIQLIIIFLDTPTNLRSFLEIDSLEIAFIRAMLNRIK